MKRWVLFVLTTFGLVSATSPMAMAGGQFQTRVTLNLSGSLTAQGVVRAGGVQDCEGQREVLVQRRGLGGGWQTIERVRTRPDGGYRATLANNAGAYRAFVPKFDIASGTCTRGVSQIRIVADPDPEPICTDGYSPCLVWHGGADYDCYGGDGNGPYYTAPGVTYSVTGYDRYGLDGDGDGYGCE
jgi:hypothetical protein